MRWPEYREEESSASDAVVHENKANENSGAGRNNTNQEMAVNQWPQNQKSLTFWILTGYEFKYFSAIKDQVKETVAGITGLAACISKQEKPDTRVLLP